MDSRITAEYDEGESVIYVSAKDFFENHDDSLGVVCELNGHSVTVPLVIHVLAEAYLTIDVDQPVEVISSQEVSIAYETNADWQNITVSSSYDDLQDREFTWEIKEGEIVFKPKYFYDDLEGTVTVVAELNGTTAETTLNFFVKAEPYIQLPYDSEIGLAITAGDTKTFVIDTNINSVEEGEIAWSCDAEHLTITYDYETKTVTVTADDYIPDEKDPITFYATLNGVTASADMVFNVTAHEAPTITLEPNYLDLTGGETYTIKVTTDADELEITWDNEDRITCTYDEYDPDTGELTITVTCTPGDYVDQYMITVVAYKYSRSVATGATCSGSILRSEEPELVLPELTEVISGKTATITPEVYDGEYKGDIVCEDERFHFTYDTETGEIFVEADADVYEDSDEVEFTVTITKNNLDVEVTSKVKLLAVPFLTIEETTIELNDCTVGSTGTISYETNASEDVKITVSEVEGLEFTVNDDNTITVTLTEESDEDRTLTATVTAELNGETTSVEVEIVVKAMPAVTLDPEEITVTSSDLNGPVKVTVHANGTITLDFNYQADDGDDGGDTEPDDENP